MSYCRSTSDERDTGKAVAKDQASVFQITLNHVFSPLYVGKKRKTPLKLLSSLQLSYIWHFIFYQLLASYPR